MGNPLDNLPDIVNPLDAIPELPRYDAKRLAQDPEFKSRANRYYAQQGRSFKTDEELQDYFMQDRTFSQGGNTYSTAKELVNARSLPAQGAEDLGYLRTVYDELPYAWQKGGRGLMPSITDNLYAAVTDPVQLVMPGIGAKVAGRIANTAAGSVLGRTGTTLAGNALADATHNAALDVVDQSAGISVGSQDGYSPVQTLAAAGIGAAVGPAQKAVLEGAKALGRTALNTPRIGRQSAAEQLRNSLNPVDSRAMQRVAEMTPTDASITENPVQYRVYNRNNTLIDTFDTADEAARRLETLGGNNSGNIIPFKGTSAIPQGRTGQLLNDVIDNMVGLKPWREAWLKQRSATDPLSEADYDPFVFGTGIARSADEVASMATTSSAGGQFSFADNKLTNIESSVGLGQILEQLPDPTDRKMLSEYMMGKRIQAISNGVNRQASIDLGIPATDYGQWHQMVRTVESRPELMNRYTPIIAQIQKWNDNLLDFAEQTGSLNPAMRNVIQDANEMYLPIHRLMEDGIDTLDQAIGRGVDRTRATLKGRTAGEAEAIFLDPLRNYARNAEAVYRLGIRNQMYRSVANMFNDLGDLGKDVVSVQPTTGQNSPSLSNLMSTYKRRQGNTLNYMDDGKVYNMTIHDPVLFKSLSTFGKSLDSSFASRLTAAFQYMVTRYPDFFIGTSLVVDPATAAAYSNSRKVTDFIPVVNVITRMMEGSKTPQLWKWHPDSKEYKEAVANGVLFSGLASSARLTQPSRILQKAGLQTEDTFGLSVAQDKKVAQKVALAYQNFMNKGKETLDYLPERIEAAPRLSELSRQKAIYGDTAAAYAAARENNVDFRTRGAAVGDGSTASSVQAYMRLVPFLRAGTNVLYRTWQARDLRTTSGNVKPGLLRTRNTESDAIGAQRQKSNFIRQMKMVFGVGLPIAALAAINADDPRYQSLRDEDRKRYYHFWIGDQPFTIRKPDDLAQFANIAEDFFSLLRRDDYSTFQALKESFLSGLADQLPGNLRSVADDPTDIFTGHLPFGVAPVVNWTFNNGPGNAPLLDKATLERAGNNQYREGVTSPLSIETAKALGPSASPAAIDYFGRQLGGPLYGLAANTSRMLDDKQPSRGVSDIPVLRRFMIDPELEKRSNNIATRFNEYQSEIETALRISKDINQYGRRDLIPAHTAQNLNYRTRALLGIKDDYAKVEREVSTLRREIAILFNRADIPQQQRQQLFEKKSKEIVAKQEELVRQTEKILGRARR